MSLSSAAHLNVSMKLPLIPGSLYETGNAYFEEVGLCHFWRGKWDLAILSWRFGDVMLWRKSCDWGLKFFKLGFGDLLI